MRVSSVRVSNEGLVSKGIGNARKSRTIFIFKCSSISSNDIFDFQSSFACSHSSTSAQGAQGGSLLALSTCRCCSHFVRNVPGSGLPAVGCRSMTGARSSSSGISSTHTRRREGVVGIGGGSSSGGLRGGESDGVLSCDVTRLFLRRDLTNNLRARVHDIARE